MKDFPGKVPGVTGRSLAKNRVNQKIILNL